MSRIRVAQVVDSLAAGGTERVAVELANHLPSDRFESWLVTTREEGPMAELAAPRVRRRALGRRGPVGVEALRTFRRWLRREHPDLIHAHSSSLFFCVLGLLGHRGIRLVWHDHYGRGDTHPRRPLPFRLAARRVDQVIAVNEELGRWSREELRIPPSRVVVLRNFVAEPSPVEPARDLPGEPADRVVCVANLRPQKGHEDLLRAFAGVVAARPAARLLLVGASPGRERQAELRGLAGELGVADHVSFLGRRDDVASVLAASAVGVLSSHSEGLPLALLEMGWAGLPVVATDVGACAEVLGGDDAGILVPPEDPAALERGVLELLSQPERARALGSALRRRVELHFSPAAATGRLIRLYERILDRPASL